MPLGEKPSADEREAPFETVSDPWSGASGSQGHQKPVAVTMANEKIDAALRSLSGIGSRPHRFGGTQYNLGNREIGHVHGDSLVDIPFPKKVRDELIAAGRAEPHHILPESGWVSIFLRQADDVDRAIELLRLSFAIAGRNRAH